MSRIHPMIQALRATLWSLTLVTAIASAQDLAPATTAETTEAPAPAGPAVPAEVVRIQTRWAEIKYQLPEDKRVEAFEQLAKEAGAVVEAMPESTEALIWHGIVLSTWAGERGGMGALKICKQARAEFEKAIARDPSAMNGSALTSLGSLYHGVPGWPIGFGDESKAEDLLRQGIGHNPEGIDSNYFLGQYLYDEDRYEEAAVALRKAMAAPPRPGRELADQGRRQEIQALLAKLAEELES